ncbi:hypothetical protein CSR02_05165 [Acetobacter pomorum]|uniref:Hedgehog/Intein (Hint) domain-containing protein n=1 Tax=Acetobacter pomorum TaxID=65959 RepID=A0A2G4RDL3_9PROT|nr:Hint domain-containing protein [Acetobacter pomorum]PHY94652.1 hypothetical protein CSR02_05165 [Acetobacter pomorum]GBR51861.1 hypothetical protein AA11825_2084 [Acetobacter pomorum DSM 11825]
MSENTNSSLPNTDINDTLAAIAEAAEAAGGSNSQYSDAGHNFHQHDNSWRWVGSPEGGDWSDPANWALYDSHNNVVDKTTGSPAVPQTEQNADANVGYYGNTNPMTIVVNAPYYNQLRSLSVWQNSTLKITADYQSGDTNGYVFATAGFENYGTILVDTSAKVELGGVNMQGGTLTIKNNDGNVVFDNDQVNNGGTINLINASLGTTANPITVSGGTVNLQQNSSLVANLWGEGATINVDPTTVNTIYVNNKNLNNDGNVQGATINGVSENTHFGILAGSSAPLAADYTHNEDGSYTLVISLDNGHSITYPKVNMADGYTPPAHVDIVEDKTTGNWLIEDKSTVPASSYTDDSTYKALASIATVTDNTGANITASSEGHNYHEHDGAWRWVGPASGGDWSDPANWALYDSSNHRIPTEDITGSPAIPQAEQNADVNVGYYGNTNPMTIVANAPYYNQLRSLSVWQDSTLKITANYQSGDTNGYVFATAGFENYGTIIVDTSAKVELGGVNSQAGTLTIMNNDGNVVFDNGQINNGSGTINLINATLGTIANPINVNGGTINLQQGSTILANLWGEGATINVDSSTVNTIYINDKNANNDGNVQGAVINNVSGNTHFGILETSSQPVSANYTKNDDGSYTLKITLEDGRSISYSHVNMAPTYQPSSDIQIVQDGTTGWLIEDKSPAACFLSGSMILTDNGNVAVEDIQVGDKIIAFDWKKQTNVARSIVWVGKTQTTVRAGVPDDEAGYPVRILKDAIADGVPYKDMLITAEHCLFFRNGFVPVRMLVNGVSIFYDKSFTSYDYYHVETEQHSVITADGMLTESYLDTGNRASFRQEGKVVALRGAVKNWDDDAGAPLNVDRSFVEPLFRALERRENNVIGCQTAPKAIETTSDPDLYLVTETGATIRPMRKTLHHYSFMLPPNTNSVRIMSHASRPCDVIGPFVDDRRYMGVAVGEVNLFCAKQQFEITSHLRAKKPDGWHADMGLAGAAWTDGNAQLSLENHLTHGQIGILSIAILAAGPYLLKTQQNFNVEKQSA